MRIYVDFNGVLSGRDSAHQAVSLERFGTLRDLCAAKLKLHDGLVLALWSDSADDEDMEVEGIAWWRPDPEKVSGGMWIAEFDPELIRYVSRSTVGRSVVDWFPCYECGANLAREIDRSQILLTDTCPSCGTPVDFPLVRGSN